MDRKCTGGVSVASPTNAQSESCRSLLLPPLRPLSADAAAGLSLAVPPLLTSRPFSLSASLLSCRLREEFSMS